MATDSKAPSAGLPGVPAAKKDSAAVPPGNGGSQSPPVAVENPLPAGDVEATKAGVIPLGGLRGGRPRKDGLLPGSPEAVAADRKKDADYQAKKRAERSALRAANPPAPVPALPAGPLAATPAATPQQMAVDFGTPIVAPVDSWKAEDFLELTRDGVPVLELWDLLDVKKSVAPLRLDAAATSEILRDSRWPEELKRSLQSGCPHTMATAFNLFRVPLTLRGKLSGALGLPALFALFQFRSDRNERIERLVREFKEREAAAPSAAKPAEKK